MFANSRFADVLFVAESFPDWMRTLAGHLRNAAAAVESGRNTDFEDAFYNRFFNALPDGWAYWSSEKEPDLDTPESLAPDGVFLTSCDALKHPDPVIVELAGQLSKESFIADLRGASGPVYIPFGRHLLDGYFRRINGGEFLLAVNGDEDEDE